jgi:3-isopropylmalate dehydrogenase
MKAHIVLLPGDGIGPEVLTQAQLVLEHVASKYNHSFTFQTCLIGGIAIDTCSNPLPDDTIQACEKADAILLGAVGGPKWDDPQAKIRPEQGLLGLRKKLNLFANLRPVRLFPELASCSPLKPERLAGVDLLVVRELTGGLYFGQPRFREETAQGLRAVDTMEYSETEIRRVVEFAFRLAQQRKRKKLTSIDKANVLESSRLWRQVTMEVAKQFPDVALDHQLVDSAAMRLITHASSFDVMVTENMFGDILTDEASVLSGSLGLLPSASLGAGTLGVYEPIHGSAPDIAGKGIANPIGSILSAAMLLRHSLLLEKEAEVVENAVAAVLAGGARTADLSSTNALSTSEMGSAICSKI